MSLVGAVNEDLQRKLDEQSGERSARLAVAGLVSGAAAACAAQALATGAGSGGWQFVITGGALLSIVLSALVWWSHRPLGSDPLARMATAERLGWTEGDFAANLLFERTLAYKRNVEVLSQRYGANAVWMIALGSGLATILAALVAMALWV
jgi:hypothetical protein